MPGPAPLARRFNIALAGAVAIGLPFVAFMQLILCHFYQRGGFVMDSGLLAALMWHSNWALPMPIFGHSFLASHFTPLFWLTSGISYCLPLSPQMFLAAYIGLCHALLALAVFWALAPAQNVPRALAPWLACLLALGFAFSGLACAIARFPHFETLIPACFLLFAVAWRRGHMGLAVFCFALGLITREDAGLHYMGFMVLLIALNTWRGIAWRQQRAAICFAVAGLAYSATVMSVQHFLFPGDNSFARIYLGNPPLSHLTPSLLGFRLLSLVVTRPYVVLPGLAAVAWAIAARNAAIALGFAACLPWLIVNLIAYSDLAGRLSSYYGFPFLMALGWPLLAAPADRRTMLAFAGLLALTFVPALSLHNPGRLSLPADFFAAPPQAQRVASDHAVAAIVAARPDLGRLIVDDSVAALAPHDFAKTEIPIWAGDAPADTVAFFTQGYDAARLRAKAAREGLDHRYVVPGTPVHLASRRALETVPALAGLLAPDP